MSGINFNLRLNEAKGMFFDRPAVTRAMSRATQKALSKFGAYVRTRSRTSIKKAPWANAYTGRVHKGRRARDMKYVRANAKAGDPPYSHTGLLKRNIYFSYDRQREGVVIGPTMLNAKGTGSPTIPAILEEGGKGISAKGRSITIAPHPFMKPAFDAELPKADKLWQNAIK